MHNFEFVSKCYAAYSSSPVDTRLSRNDSMNNEWYFEVGQSAVEIITAGCLASNVNHVGRVLDVPCGHGRVLRHLVKLFPDAQFDACDLDVDGVNYCAETFGAKAVLSHPDLATVDFGARYDLIWVGSLFTHTSQQTTQKWMTHLASFLAPNGIIVATFHGRWSEFVHKRVGYIAEERWQQILMGYNAVGYGYCDYAQEESHEFIKGSYGISLAKPHKLVEMIERIPDIRIFLYRERAWADHQDVAVFGRPAFDTPWPQPAAAA